MILVAWALRKDISLPTFYLATAWPKPWGAAGNKSTPNRVLIAHWTSVSWVTGPNDLTWSNRGNLTHTTGSQPGTHKYTNYLPTLAGNTHAWLKNGGYRRRIINSAFIFFIFEKWENCRISHYAHKVSWCESRIQYARPILFLWILNIGTNVFAAIILTYKS